MWGGGVIRRIFFIKNLYFLFQIKSFPPQQRRKRWLPASRVQHEPQLLREFEGELLNIVCQLKSTNICFGLIVFAKYLGGVLLVNKDYFLKIWLIPSSISFIFVLFLFQQQYSFNFNNLNWKNHRWCSNPGLQDGRRRLNHEAMASAPTNITFNSKGPEFDSAIQQM